MHTPLFVSLQNFQPPPPPPTTTTTLGTYTPKFLSLVMWNSILHQSAAASVLQCSCSHLFYAIANGKVFVQQSVQLCQTEIPIQVLHVQVLCYKAHMDIAPHTASLPTISSHTCKRFTYQSNQKWCNDTTNSSKH